MRTLVVLIVALTLAQCGGQEPRPEGGVLLVGESRFGFEQTVDSITAAAAAAGWKNPVTHDLQASLRSAGEAIPPTMVIELCKPSISRRILSEDSTRPVSALMPCRVAVVEQSDGTVLISRIDAGTFGQLLGGSAAGAMMDAADEIETLLADVLRRPAGI